MFDKDRFNSENFRDRTDAVPVDELTAWFADGAPAVWTVRGLEGKELARVRAAEEARRDLAGLVAKLASGSDKERASGLMEALGLTDAVTPDFSGRIEGLCIGSVDPACDRPTAVRLAKNFPAVFYRITNRILELTGSGRVGESTASGTTPPSGPASPCVPGEVSAEEASASSSK